ncbi:MAG: hypothetical protein CVV27_05270, partial [Candidatus Melainabacteria bacterium HGW-Melainabacteria-1]
MQRNKLGLSLFVILALIACQPAPTEGPVLPQAPAAASAYKQGSVEDMPLRARIEHTASGDRLVLGLSPGLRARLNPRSAKGFSTQAADVSQLAFLQISVTGPGISSPINSAMLSIGGAVNDVVMQNIPPGSNRVIKAQFFDANQQPIVNAVAMGVYSSNGSSSAISVDVRRRFLVLGRVIQQLLSTQPNLVAGMDVSALQSQIDRRQYGGDGTPGPFLVDPALIDSSLIVNNLTAANGIIASLDISQLAYVFTTSTLTLPVTGLLGSDTLTVRVDDPTSTAVTQGNGTITITNIAPGTWPVYVTLNSSANFTYPGTTLGGTILQPTGQSGAQLLIPAQSFTPGQAAPQANYDLVPAAPQISTAAGIFTRSGSQLTISGSGFYPGVPAANKVRFVQGGTTLNATVTSATATELVVTVPAVVQAGAYDLGFAIGNGAFTSLGTVVLNVLTATPNGPNYNALTSNGQGWAKAINLQAALGAAVAGDEIWVAAGTHKPGTLRADTFTLKSNVPVYGGFAGNEVVRTARDFNTNISILDGDVLGNDNSVVTTGDPNRSENNEHVVTSTTANITLDGLTIQGGNTIGLSF